MAKNIASSLERGYHFRRAAYSSLRAIMNAGAIGAQITLSGKVTGERSRKEKLEDGYIKHCGEPADRLVLKGFAEAAPKLGRIGVKVKILPPHVQLPDQIRFTEEIEKPVEEVEPVETTPTVTETETPSESTVTKETDKKKKKVKKAVKKTKPKSVKKKEEPSLLDKASKDILKEIKNMNKKEITALLKKESAGKNRKTVIEGIKKVITKK
jgi:small subunit ribosomal protein S3